MSKNDFSHGLLAHDYTVFFQMSRDYYTSRLRTVVPQKMRKHSSSNLDVENSKYTKLKKSRKAPVTRRRQELYDLSPKHTSRDQGGARTREYDLRLLDSEMVWHL